MTHSLSLSLHVKNLLIMFALILSMAAFVLAVTSQGVEAQSSFPQVDCTEEDHGHLDMFFMGRYEACGYFHNWYGFGEEEPTGDFVTDFNNLIGWSLVYSYEDVVNANQFIDVVETDLHRNFSACDDPIDVRPDRHAPSHTLRACTYRKAQANHAAYIILMMVGYPRGDEYGDIDTAKAEFDEWEQRVRYYDENGWIDFNHVGSMSGPTAASWFYGHDVSSVWQDYVPSEIDPEFAIAFTHPDDTGDDASFYLLRFCGNLKGEEIELASPGLEPTLTSPQEGNRYDEFSGDIVVAGEVENTGGVSTEGREVNVELTISQGGNLVESLDNQSSIRKGQPWQSGGWSYSGSGNTNEYFTPENTFASTDTYSSFTRVREDLDTGGEVCFRLTVTPHTSSSGSSASDEVCIIVEAPDRPFVTTEGGDVHGGAVLVDPALSRETCRMEDEEEADVRGQVRPFPPHGSRSTYAVSATGSITNFGSGGVAHGNTLTFGNTPDSGSYRTVCRPDLTSINYYRSLGFPVIETDASFAVIIFGINQGTWDNSVIVSTRSQLTAGNTSLNAGRQATIIATGDLTINGTITTSSGTRSSVSDIPALALVSAGDIDITSNAASIQAYLSSNGTINTCSDVDITSEDIGPCNTALDIRGALLAETILFRRTGGDFRGGDPAETITHAPELYLSPPPGLFGLTNNIFAETPVRERPPRF